MDTFAEKQKLAKPARYYGDGGTIHGNSELDIEVDGNGEVVSVWFRCQALPFKTHNVGRERASSMKKLYDEYQVKLTGVEVLDN